jgi:hypothetical protein
MYTSAHLLNIAENIAKAQETETSSICAVDKAKQSMAETDETVRPF